MPAPSKQLETGPGANLFFFIVSYFSLSLSLSLLLSKSQNRPCCLSLRRANLAGHLLGQDKPSTQSLTIITCSASCINVSTCRADKSRKCPHMRRSISAYRQLVAKMTPALASKCSAETCKKNASNSLAETCKKNASKCLAENARKCGR